MAISPKILKNSNCLLTVKVIWALPMKLPYQK